ncbi:hypothetical protein CDAR_574181 [Caerostris darwini]|uniref:DM13 domain-containing protein n=1 Tax=Caerostris darwini TaxID=1538125 RepID=A0AAV4MGU8_9ARAC|nr:hypothetical protein CDAR_574181 [Caerostris darwini]
MAVLVTVVVASFLQVIFCVLKFIFQDDIVSLCLVIEYVFMMRFIRTFIFSDLSGTANMLKVNAIGSDEPKFIKGNRDPIIYSKDVRLLCDASGIEAELSFAEDGMIETSKPIVTPLVRSREVWFFCQALGLKAELTE